LQKELANGNNPILLSASQKYWVAAAKGKNGNHNASYKMQLYDYRQRW